MTVNTLPRRARRMPTADETPDEAIARHVRHIAADPVLTAYHRDREAALLERVAKLVDLDDDHDDAGDAVRFLASQHRAGVAL